VNDCPLTFRDFAQSDQDIKINRLIISVVALLRFDFSGKATLS